MLRLSQKTFLAAALMMPLSVSATSPAPAGDAPFNVMLFALVSLVVVMIAANALLANVLKQLALALRDKTRQERGRGNIISTALLAVMLMIPAGNALAQATTGAAKDAPAEVYESPFISGVPRTDFYFLVGLLGFLMLVMLVLILLVRMLTNELRGIPAKAHVPALIFRKNFLDVFNKSVAVDKEESIVLDHDYDGIRELDNDLPPWWKWGFVLTIIVACTYLGYYHIAGGPHQIDEYTAAVAQAEEEKAAYLAKSGEKIDETNVTKVLDAAALDNAKTVFKNTCAACHREDAGGNVGPNLTDDYWLHGGSLKDVFKSIKYGWKDKGMPEWQNSLTAKQIAALASYVKSLKDTRPTGPKPPQGELFVEGGDKAIDSVSNKTDPSLDPSGRKENKDNPLLPLERPVLKK